MDETNRMTGQENAKTQIVARATMVIAAMALVAAFFLPWAAADEEYRDAAAQVPDAMYYEPVGMTVEEAVDLSLIEYAQLYGSMEGTGWVIYQYLIYAGVAVAAIALVLAMLGKPIGATVFAVLTLAISRVLVWDFGDRGVLPNDTHGWGIATTVFIVAAIALVAAALWMFVLKRREKAAGGVATVDV